MVDGSTDATRLLGLAGLAVERVALTPVAIRVVQLVTNDPDAARCPGCQQVSSLGEPQPTAVLGLDEVRFGRPRWQRAADGRWTRTDPWETGFVDLAGGQGLLGQVDGRTSAAVRAWLAQRSGAFRDGVQTVVIDPHAGYAAAVRAALPHARIAVDHFHLIPAREHGRDRGAPAGHP